MEHSLHNEYRSINKNKILNKKKTLQIGMVDKLVVMLAVEGSFVELGDGAEGGFVELEDGAEGGDVGGKAEGGLVELSEDGEFEDLGLRVWREWEFRIEREWKWEW